MPSDDTTTATTLQTDLRRLGFRHTADQLNDLVAEATRKRWSPTVLLERIVADELEEKHRRSVESRLKRARLGRFKPLADWDWNWPSALDRPALELELPQFRGHLSSWRGGGVHDAEVETAVPGGIPTADGRAGSVRT